MAHPRSNPDKIERKFDDAQLQSLQEKLEAIPGVNVHLVRLEKMSFLEQLKLMRKAHVLIGIHGAAHSHLMFMDENQSHIIELQSPSHYNFFSYLSEWKGLHYKHVDLDHTTPTPSLTERGIYETVQLVNEYMKEGSG